ncbi:hypothetical protein [Sphaerospermopsis sp. FACHB-1194]|nr:hypothetical protein [Sphaerospermopsis sp. FACHB-1194]
MIKINNCSPESFARTGGRRQKFKESGVWLRHASLSGRITK